MVRPIPSRAQGPPSSDRSGIVRRDPLRYESGFAHVGRCNTCLELAGALDHAERDCGACRADFAQWPAGNLCAFGDRRRLVPGSSCIYLGNDFLHDDAGSRRISEKRPSPAQWREKHAVIPVGTPLNLSSAVERTSLICRFGIELKIRKNLQTRSSWCLTISPRISVLRPANCGFSAQSCAGRAPPEKPERPDLAKHPW